MIKFLVAVGVAALALAMNADVSEARSKKCCCIPRVHVKKHRVKHRVVRSHKAKHHKRYRRYSAAIQGGDIGTLPPPPPRVRYIQAPAPEPEVRYVQTPAPQPQVVYVQTPPPPPRVVYLQAPPPPMRVIYRLPPPPMRVIYRLPPPPPPMIMGGGYGYNYGFQKRVRLVRINGNMPIPY